MTFYRRIRHVSCVVALAAGACAMNTDTVDMSTMQGNDTATVVLRGRRADCTPYEVTRGSPQAAVDNFVSSGQCPSEVAVFARDNAMGLKDTASTWTDSANDVASVPMRAVYVLPVNVLVLTGHLLSGTTADRIVEATSNVNSATELWNRNQCGVTFTVAQMVDETKRGGTLPSSQLLSTTSCQDIGALKSVDPKTTAAAAVNVFYYDGSDTTLGRTCRDGNSAVILISKWSTDDTLAHELGHAMSLLDLDPDPNGPDKNMPADNLMMSPTADPTMLPNGLRLTAGQCFRTNVCDASVLNSLNVRNAPHRLCSSVNTPDLSIH
jgi:hypothetical protein